VPGNIDNPGFYGANQLIKDGAKLVTSALDIVEEYVHIFPEKLAFRHKGRRFFGEYPADGGLPDGPAPEKAPQKPKPEQREGLSGDELKIVRALQDGRLHIDAISERTGIDPRVLSAMLTMLEIRKIIRQSPGKYFEMHTQQEERFA